MSTMFDTSTAPGADAIRHMREDVVAWLTTVAPDGTPQSSIVCFFWDGESIVTYSRPGAPKVANIRANPRVCFHLNSDEYGNHMVTIEGTARIDTSAPPTDQVPAYLAKHRRPYEVWGMDPHRTAEDFSLALRITPDRVRVW